MIYTGYFAKVKEYEKAGLHPISIAEKAPDFYKGAQYKSLAPNYRLFTDWKKGKISDMEYTALFKDYLKTVDKQAVLRTLKSYGNDNVILICYEKPGDFCHRHIVADWIEQEFNIRVEEYDQIATNNEKDAIATMKRLYITEDYLRKVFKIENTKEFLKELNEHAPEGYFLYKIGIEGEPHYGLELVEDWMDRYEDDSKLYYDYCESEV